jgi:peptide/nickel transport system permease protein
MSAVIHTLLRRLGFGILTLFVVSIVIFAAMAQLPGDYARARLGQAATPDTVEAFEREIGLDRPPLARYLLWVGGVLRGDFGNSFSGAGGPPVTVVSLISPRLRNTLFLASFAAVVAVPLALALGVLGALWRNSLFDRLANVLTLASISVPEFFVAYILIMALSVKFQIFSSLADVSPETPLLDRVALCVLPAATLVLVTVAHMMRMTRASLLSLLANPYIETARLKGLSPRRIILRHALPNAWAPIAAVIAVNLGYLVVGVVVVEVVFAYPGIGQLLVDSVSTRDVPVVQGCALIFAAAYIVLNLVADVVAIVTNPRLLHPR